MAKMVVLTSFVILTLLAFIPTVLADEFTTDFETGYLQGWTKTGDTFDFQPTKGDNPTARGRGQPSMHEGEWWIGGFEKYQGKPGQKAGDVQGDSPKGTLTSAPFTIIGEKINFLIGGGNHPIGDPAGATAVVLEIDGKVVRKATGKNHETMERIEWNVAEFKGKLAVIKIIDDNSGGWGHINCDDFNILDAKGKELPFSSVQVPAEQAMLAVRAAPSGPDWTTISKVFINIEDLNSPPLRVPRSSMSSGIISEAHSDLKITFSGEVYTSGGKRMFVRALVDGQPANPSDVVFAQGGFTGTRSFTFTKKNLREGGHWVEIQWHTDPGGTAHIGDGTLTLCSSSAVTKHGKVSVKAAPSGPAKTTTSTGWVDVPDMSSNITTAVNSNLEITFGGEVYTSGGKRMFVRALVDGEPANPSDVVFAQGGFTGTHSFTFTKENLGAGPHSIKIQWHTDSGGTAYIGDRTLSLYSSPEITKHGGLSVKAAPSGPDKTTTSTSWMDVPDMNSSIAAEANSNLEITFSGEVYTSGVKRMFVRALVDGQPANPSDVVFAQGGFTGTHSFTFTKENLVAGPHSIKIQWHTDSGGTAYIGDRTLSLNYWRRQVPDLSKPFYSLKPVIGMRKVLVILWDPHRPDHPAPSKSAVENVIFGSKPSVSDYFLENSGGRFKMESAGVLGWYDADKPADHYWGPWDQEDLPEDRNRNGIIDSGEDLNNNGKLDGPDGILQPDEDTNGNGKLDYDLNGDGWISGHAEKWADAIRKADKDFNYKKYDINNDNILSPDELAVLIVIPQNSPFGTQRPVVGKQYPKTEPLIVDGVRINTMVEAYIGSPPSLGLVAHELSHILLGTADMYFQHPLPTDCQYRAGSYSLMDHAPHNPSHLDPFHKLRLGWLVPKVVTSDGWYKIPEVETHHEVYIMYDPSRSDKEYYIIENRWPGNSYDSYLPDSGLAVWHIIEDQNVFGALQAPPGVDSSAWNRIGTHDWGRRAVRMIRPIQTLPTNNWMSLWDGSDSQTGYDLLSVDPDPNHATLKWADGTPSGFSIQSIPASSSEMTVYIKML